jgi:hypothetical protein
MIRPLILPAEPQRRQYDALLPWRRRRLHPEGGEECRGGQGFMKYFMQPQVMNENLKNGLGRWVPVYPQIVKDDPWWTDTKDVPHRSP